MDPRMWIKSSNKQRAEHTHLSVTKWTTDFIGLTETHWFLAYVFASVEVESEQTHEGLVTPYC